MPKSDSEAVADRALRTRQVVSIRLAKKLRLEFEVGTIGPSYWTLWFGEDFATSIDASDATALISAASGVPDALRVTRRRLGKDEFNEMLASERSEADTARARSS